jgi:transketolase
MLNDSQKLNPKLFKEAVEEVPVRNGFGEGLAKAGEEDPRIVGLCADLVESTKMLDFAKRFPHRFIEIGIAEQNLAAVAAGMAAMGKIPFITSYAMFSPGRNWEQIRTTICYNNQNVKIVGSHAGVSVGPDGGTHQAIEDIALMRIIPRMTVVVPCDHIEARKATHHLARLVGPAYLRLAREKTPVVTTDESPFIVGKANLLRQAAKPRAAIIACGPVLYQALQAADDLAGEGIDVSVLNLHTIKPLDGDALTFLAQTAGAIVTVEEHQRKGGMGSAVAEYLAEHQPVPIEFIGVDDQFGQSGEPNELLKHYGISVPAIKSAVTRVIERKSK